jgi:hypothetical protein
VETLYRDREEARGRVKIARSQILAGLGLVEMGVAYVGVAL